MPRMYAVIIFLMTAIFFSAYPMNASAFGLGIAQGWLWIFVLAAVTLPMNLSLIRADQQISRSPILAWGIGLGSIVLLWHFVSPDPSASVAMIVKFMWFLLTLVLAFTMFRTKAARRIGLRAVLCVVIVSVIVNLVQAAAGDYRPSGMYGNPNTAGFALVMGMILTHTLVPSRYRFPYQLVVLAGVFSTASRGSLLLWGISVVLLFFLNDERQTQTRWATFSMIAIFLIAVSPLGTSVMDSLGESQGPADRLLSLGSRSELANDERVTLAEMAIQDVKDNLIIGSGTGQATVRYAEIDYGPHNMFLALMMQFGLIGFFIMPALALVLVGSPSRRYQFSIPFGVLVLIACQFSHTMLEQWQYAFAFALVAQMQGNEFLATGPQRSPRPYLRSSMPVPA